MSILIFVVVISVDSVAHLYITHCKKVIINEN